MARNKSESYEAMEEGSEAHWEVVQRILFLYAKLNPGLGYVQGMNEIIGPIYYVMASDPLADNRSKYTALIDCDWVYSSTSEAIFFSFRLIIHHLTTVDRIRRGWLFFLFYGVDERDPRLFHQNTGRIRRWHQAENGSTVGTVEREGRRSVAAPGAAKSVPAVLQFSLANTDIVARVCIARRC